MQNVKGKWRNDMSSYVTRLVQKDFAGKWNCSYADTLNHESMNA